MIPYKLGQTINFIDSLGQSFVLTVTSDTMTWWSLEGERINDRTVSLQTEYGAGLGAAVYIKNIIGFYIEAMGGQFSYYSLLVKSPYDIRFGLTAKF